MLSGLLGLAVAAMFTGAALYINVAEQPARLHLDDAALLAQWKSAYKRGYAMQAPLAGLGFVSGMLAWRQSGAIPFLAGGVLMLANWPWTLLVIMPVNSLLMNTDPVAASAKTRTAIRRWNVLHGVRTCFGAGATLAFLAGFFWH